MWFDVDKVDVIVDLPNSGIGLVVSEIARHKNKLFLATGPATPDLTGPKCSPNTIHWVYDSWAVANGTGKATVKAGGDSWFFLTADYAGGYALENSAVAVIEASGGKVLGKVRHPLNTNDFVVQLWRWSSLGACDCVQQTAELRDGTPVRQFRYSETVPGANTQSRVHEQVGARWRVELSLRTTSSRAMRGGNCLVSGGRSLPHRKRAPRFSED
jgi:Periplasmic binding protein